MCFKLSFGLLLVFHKVIFSLSLTMFKFPFSCSHATMPKEDQPGEEEEESFFDAEGDDDDDGDD